VKAYGEPRSMVTGGIIARTRRFEKRLLRSGFVQSLLVCWLFSPNRFDKTHDNRSWSSVALCVTSGLLLLIILHSADDVSFGVFKEN
jgi:hypothetical protein